MNKALADIRVRTVIAVVAPEWNLRGFMEYEAEERQRKYSGCDGVLFLHIRKLTDLTGVRVSQVNWLDGWESVMTKAQLWWLYMYRYLPDVSGEFDPVWGLSRDLLGNP